MSPASANLQVSGIVGRGDQFAELAARLAAGEMRVSCPGPGRALLCVFDGYVALHTFARTSRDATRS